ncbi:MAG: M14 family zinc carboxypeptidase [Thermoanaerobaculia bacterium]
MIRIPTLLLAGLLSVAAHGFSPQELWQAWPEERFETTVAPCLRHARLMESLQELESRFPDSLRLDEVGKSFLGRSIRMLTLGNGEKKILLWSQMHGDEPAATPALLDIAHYLLEHADEPAAWSILDNFTLLMIPMLNPDGAEVYERRNAQAIDINRDALNLVTPEGRALKRVRDEHEPMLGFNLHDQNRRTAVGDTGLLATNAVLAVAGDPENTLTPGRLRAKRACAAIVEALAPFMPGGMARYDEDWSPRAFGDNLTAWGTPVVLIESGGVPSGHEFKVLTRLNFVALLSVLQDLARDDLAGHDPQVYEDLLRNQSNSWSDVVVRDGFLLQPGTDRAYRADLAFDRLRSDRQDVGCSRGATARSRIFEIGDARFLGAGQSLDATDSLILAPFEVGVEGWSARKWLDEVNLSRLARLGVGTLYWSVSQRRSEAARDLARNSSAEGLPRIEIVAAASPLPGLVLSGPPAEARSASLAGVLQTLGAEEWSTLEALQGLWVREPGTEPNPPRLRTGLAASFLLVSPAPEGRIDVNETDLTAVWLDGHKIEGTP